MVETKPQEENIILEENKEVLEESPQKEEPNKEQELTISLQRLQAEFENFRRRTEKEKAETIFNANQNIISELLPTLDNFELSLKHNADPGVKMIYEEILKTLNSQGLKKIDTSIPFDPKFHEAILQEEGKKPGIILEELQKGYLLGDKLLRASKVKISKKQEK